MHLPTWMGQHCGQAYIRKVRYLRVRMEIGHDFECFVVELSTVCRSDAETVLKLRRNTHKNNLFTN